MNRRANIGVCIGRVKPFHQIDKYVVARKFGRTQILHIRKNYINCKCNNAGYTQKGVELFKCRDIVKQGIKRHKGKKTIPQNIGYYKKFAKGYKVVKRTVNGINGRYIFFGKHKSCYVYRPEKQ